LAHGGDKEGVFLKDGDEILGHIIVKNLEGGDSWDRKIITAGSRGEQSITMLLLRLMCPLPEFVIPSTSIDRILKLRSFQEITLTKVLQ
jgi:hypothetical protein